MRRKIERWVVAASAVAVLGFYAHGTDAAQIDCEVILCLAGSFSPAECNPAHSYMMSRLKQIPPKPPFGICKTASSNGNTTVYNDAQARLTQTRTPPICVSYAPQSRDDDGGWCNRECWTNQSNVDLTIRNVGPSGTYRSVYTYAENRQCHGLTKWGTPIKDGK